MGFNAWFFSRIDYQDKVKRLNESRMEMLWQPQTSQGSENNIFTQVTYHHYEWPEHFGFDDKSGDYDPIRADKRLEDYNIDSKAKEFESWFREMCNHYQSTTLMHTFGDDFAYGNAWKDFKNMDLLFSYINEHEEEYNMNVTYSTPEEYIKEIHEQQI